MADRMPAKRIAKELDISTNTARRHCQAVLLRLGLHSRDDVAVTILRGRYVSSAGLGTAPQASTLLPAIAGA